MNIKKLEKYIKLLERIRDILLKSGIRSDRDDQRLQRICNEIDQSYQDLLDALRSKEGLRKHSKPSGARNSKLSA